MPTYLFTFHGRGTWMPDHARGYVHRQRGLQPPSPPMAACYRGQQREPEVRFEPPHQRVLVDAARDTGQYLDATIHAVATEPTHLHVLVNWRHARPWRSIRRSIRGALSRKLNGAFGKRDWFAEYPSRKRVRDFEHFDYLVLAYLPRHRGLHWTREKTAQRCEARDQKRAVSVRARRRKRRKTGESKPR